MLKKLVALNALMTSKHMKQNKFKQTAIEKIPENWRVIEFGKLLKENTRNGIYKPKKFHGTGIKIVNMKELFAYEWIGSQAMTMIDLTENEKKNFLLNPGDLIFARRSLVASGAGKCSLIVEHSEPLTFESSIIRARPDEKLSNPLFLYYLFRSSYGKYIVGTILRQVAVSGITGSDLVKLPLPIPPLSEQKDIANELFTIDSKIELNHQMNKTLETIAQAIFKHWFVDFEFPNEEGKPYKSSGGEMVDSELGEIPKGWEAGKLDEFIIITSGKRPEQKSEVKDSVFNIPLVGASSVMGFVMEPLFKEPVLIIGRVGTHGVVQRFTTPTYPSDNTLIIRSPFYEYVYQVLKRIDYASLNVGSTQPLITQSSIKNYSIIIPEEIVLSNFENTVSVLFAKGNVNNHEIENLSKIRDTLLPKLMSGVVRINI